MGENEYKVGKRPKSWREDAQAITFIVTEDCNLRCKYCYITHKSPNKKMSLDVAKEFIDYILNSSFFKKNAIVIEFIGGEPLLEVELIDQICDYFKIKTFELNNDWYWNYAISICTNGINYSNENVQKLIKKNYGKIHITITLDGTKEKHDLQRVFPNGSGSYDIVKENVKLWLTQFKGSTKVTFASDDLCMLKDSIIQLWNDGILEIAANVVFENVWKEGDDILFENQLKDLADYILNNKLYSKYICSLFDDSIGEPYTEESLNRTSCGAGKMLAIGPMGIIYPCLRYNNYSLNNKEAYELGDIKNGIDYEKLRPFGALMYKYQSDDECLKCKVASGCTFCQGFNYDEADTSTNFQRAKYICKMHKARVRANNYYFAKLFNKFGIERKNHNNEAQILKFILSDDYVTICSNSNNNSSDFNSIKKMEKQIILKGLYYAHEYFMKPVFIHSNNTFNFEYYEEYDNFRILHILPAKFFKEASVFKEYLLVFDKSTVNLEVQYIQNSILNIEQDDVDHLADYVIELFKKTDRINLNILNYDKSFNIENYEKQLVIIKEYIANTVYSENKMKEINILTDILFLERHINCNAGVDSFAYTPEGNFYICQAFYSQDQKNEIGNINLGMYNLKNQHLYTKDFAPLCNLCDAYHCENCISMNKKYTNEVNISPSFQCKKSHIERKISQELYNEISKNIKLIKKPKPISYNDPFEILDLIKKGEFILNENNKNVNSLLNH